MPIYAYKCESCGHAKDVLQKMSDDPLSVCPACGQASFKKQLTSAGFQLKGSGWYVTDFREGNKPAATAPSTTADSTAAATSKPTDASATPAAASPAPAAAPAVAPSSTPSTST